MVNGRPKSCSPPVLSLLSLAHTLYYTHLGTYTLAHLLARYCTACSTYIHTYRAHHHALRTITTITQYIRSTSALALPLSSTHLTPPPPLPPPPPQKKTAQGKFTQGQAARSLPLKSPQTPPLPLLNFHFQISYPLSPFHPIITPPFPPGFFSFGLLKTSTSIHH